jgi:hypothetical protein
MMRDAKSRRLRRTVLVTVAALVVLVLTLPVTLPSPLRTRLAAAVGERFGGTVDLSTLRVSVFPRLRVAGETVVVRYRGRPDVPPLITIDSFSAEAGLFGLLGRPLRLTRVRLEGLEVNVPPGGLDIDDGDEAVSGTTGDDDADSSPLIVDDLESDNAVLRILRRTPGKRPREFAIERLSMRDTGATTPWQFKASLTNPTPPGQIEAEGTFGPWNAAEPSQTALAARYTFHDADLGDFEGLRGILRSEGAFSGVLERIEVDGRTDVPEFALADVGHAVRLQTRFHSIVDGTNGNTWLRPVDATFLRTIVHATGGVVERGGEDGRTVQLDVVMDQARIEDVLYLAVKGKEPPMSGALKVRASLELPPGDRDPIDKLRLDGSFEIESGRFGAGSVQAKVNELSQKAQVKEGGSGDDVVSDLSGRFVMRDGRISFSRLSFAVPGARVDLNGAYTIRSETLDFRGTVRLDARLSELTSAGKAILLKLIEPLFRRKNVTVVPVTIGGTVDQPKIGLDVGRRSRRSDPAATVPDLKMRPECPARVSCDVKGSPSTTRRPRPPRPAETPRARGRLRCCHAARASARGRRAIAG